MKTAIRLMPSSRCRGYTLIEMIMVIVIISIIGLVSSLAIMEGMKIYSRTVPEMDLSYQSNLALLRLKNDIRELNSTAEITQFSANAFQFKDSKGRRISYRFDGKDLSRNGDLLAQGLTSFTFNFWTADGKRAKQAKDLHLVEFDFTVEVKGATRRIRTPVFPRRLGV